MISVLLIILAIPTGYIIAWFARDELIMGRKWFKALIALSVILSLLFIVKAMKAEAFSSLFIGIVAVISLQKSYDKKWTKRNI
ncbi:hypothetical protein KW787_01775 [Candidatus Pacearchaeota archaeon]|nr:hypothetical protein [Candidatus Pacearchaeota archaeon]